MNRILASLGAVAVGTTALQTANAVDLTPQESTKPWSLGVALRGFYDDNYLIRQRDDPRGSRDSFGFEVRPTVGLNIPLERTYFGVDYTFSGKWYEDRSSSDDDAWDYSHLANLELSHSFTEQIVLDVTDRFVYTTEPGLIDPDFASVARTDQNNLSNRGDISLSMGLSRRVGLVIGYQNWLVNYEDDNPAAESTPVIAPSLSAQLDRMEHLIPINLRHQTGPQTVTLLGFNYKMVDHTSDEFLTIDAAGPQKADVRNNRSYIGYVGVEHNFTPLLNIGARGGGQYTEYYNDSLQGNWLTPYGSVTFGYRYAIGSQFQVGYNLGQAQTSEFLPSGAGGTVTQNRLNSSLSATLNHQFLPQFHGRLYGNWQLSQFNGGAYDGMDSSLFIVGASLRYDINRFLSADLSYYLDYMEGEDIPNRNFTRNRIWIGLTAKY